MLEALACGLPIAAYPCAAAPSLLKDPQNGYCHDRLMNSVNDVLKLIQTDTSTEQAERHAFIAEKYSSRHMAELFLDNLVAFKETRPVSVQTSTGPPAADFP